MHRAQVYLGFLISSLILMYGCHSGVELLGDYSSFQSPYTFYLYKDSTFSYRYKFEYAYEYSQGTWSQVGGKMIVLNSQIKNRTLAVEAQNLDDNASEIINHFSIDVNLINGNKNHYQCMIFINDTLFTIKTCDSLSSILINSPIKDYFFKLTTDTRMPTRFLDTLSTNKIFTKSSNSNNFKIKINLVDSLFNYRIFNNDILQVTNKGLNFYDSHLNQWQLIPKKK
jgi:hypothetical protein